PAHGVLGGAVGGRRADRRSELVELARRGAPVVLRAGAGADRALAVEGVEQGQARLLPARVLGRGPEAAVLDVPGEVQQVGRAHPRDERARGVRVAEVGPVPARPAAEAVDRAGADRLDLEPALEQRTDRVAPDEAPR